jgi:hypothetical protein
MIVEIMISWDGVPYRMVAMLTHRLATVPTVLTGKSTE